MKRKKTVIPAVLLDQDEQKIFADDEDEVREESPKSSGKLCQSLVDFDSLAECIGLKKLGTSFYNSAKRAYLHESFDTSREKRVYVNYG